MLRSAVARPAMVRPISSPAHACAGAVLTTLLDYCYRWCC